MKKTLLSSLLFIGIVLQSMKGISQPETSYDVISFAKKILGSPLLSLKDSLRCVDGNFQMYPSSTKRCRSFEYVSLDKTIRMLGKNIFSMSFVFTDTTGIIDNVSVMTSYNKTDMPAYQEQFVKDFEELLKYLRSVFRSRGSKGLHYKGRYSKQSNTQWKADGFVFTLTKDEIHKTQKHSNFYVITFTVFKDDKSVN